VSSVSSRCSRGPWRPVTTLAGDPGAIPDLVNRDFTAARPGSKLVGDTTYIPTWEGFLYLATVLRLAGGWGSRDPRFGHAQPSNV
jgi:transposase InsO family protein